MKITTDRPITEPLDNITVTGATHGKLHVSDGDGVEYVCTPAKEKFSFLASGAQGTHTVLQLDSEGCLLNKASFRLACHTHLEDEGGRFHSLLESLYTTMVNSCGGDGSTHHSANGKTYKYFICWLRDHTHTLKGMKYFC